MICKCIQYDTVVRFKIRRNMQMRKLMKAFSEQKGRPLGSLIFTFDGVRIGGDSTPVDVSYYLSNAYSHRK